MSNKNKFAFFIFLFSCFNLSSQSKFLLELDLISRNIEHYKYIESSPFSPSYEKFEDVSFLSLDLGGEKNYSFSLKYQINKFTRASVAYNYSRLNNYLVLKPHLFVDEKSGYGFGLIAKSHSFPIQVEFNLPICKANKKLRMYPFIGLNIIYNKGMIGKSNWGGILEYKYYNQVYANNIFEFDFDFHRKWNLGFRYGASIEYKLYKGIRMNIAFTQQIGLFEIQRTNFDISHIDKLFNRNMGSTGEWINKQTLKNKSFGILIPMDWLKKVVNTKTGKEIFSK